jgi:urate oxidase / 2-oxo-4-hydroxy-4-carboxy-5-ureidoimidazoline decarboxylase
VEQFASGSKRHYYGKGDVVVYRLHRTSQASGSRRPVFGASVLMLVYGDAFWPTYTTGDNTGLIATDSMKNYIQRQTLEFAGDDLDGYCRFLGQGFLDTYPHVEGVQVSAVEIPYSPLPAGVGHRPSGPECATARVELARTGLVEAVSGLRGFRLLRLGGSAFHGFLRDQYTTLPDLFDRPLHMWLDLEWQYTNPTDAFNDGAVAARARTIVHEVFESGVSGSIQQLIHRMATTLLDELATLSEVRLEANNRTWDTIAEHGAFGVYTEARPPYGCLGLRLKRQLP